MVSMIVAGVSRILFGTLSRDYATTAKKDGPIAWVDLP